MDTINRHTKIVTLLKQHPKSLDAMIKLSPKFGKLKNPFLRKIMAPRTSIDMACQIGKCKLEDFLDAMNSLGFQIENNLSIVEEKSNHLLPDFMKNIQKYTIVELDVRPMIEEGKDPFQIIIKTIKTIKTHEIFKLINTFEPLPLINILNKQGIETYVENISDDLIYTYIHCEGKVQDFVITHKNTETWKSIFHKYEHNLQTIDVRELEMPLPMITILETLENMPHHKALFVYHKCVPVYLLPELEEKGFQCCIEEIDNSNVHLLIYKS